MAKIHTHYDNLKVARMAPQEVIRAAYKALSQKYHPDKNPGDEKAARIMAIVNTAYGILADPVRRKEHDEWIAAEEWEIAWLESTSEDGGKGHAPSSHAWEPQAVPTRIRQRLLKEPLTWLAMAAVFTVGCAVGALALPPAASLRTAAAPLPPAAARPAPAPAPAPIAVTQVAAPVTVADDWAGPHTGAAPVDKSGLQTLAVMELAVPARAADCSTQLHSATAPNGKPWPAATGYVDGYAVANQGEHMRVNIDNARNESAVFVRLIDLDRGASVRHAYVLPHEALSIDRLSAGRYQVRYQNVDPGGVRGNCTLAALKPENAAP
ncbi:MAG: J domain-containing protein [Massilia sp.]